MSHLFNFAFISFALRNRSRNIVLQFMSQSVLLVHSSRSFMGSGLTFRVLIILRFFFFYYDVRKCSNLILLHVPVQFFQHCLLKRLCFSTVYSCFLCFLFTIGAWVYFCALYSIPFIYVSVFVPVP